jgi:hypothetical protein
MAAAISVKAAMPDRKSVPRANADAAFEKARSQARARHQDDAEVAADAQDANTARLKGLRLAKEQSDRDAVRAAPPKKAPSKTKVGPAKKK